MHVGMAAVFQNPQQRRPDREVYRDELRLADLAEPLGFESIWGVEHHFTDYTMCPDVLQFLTYMAGRTRRAQLGSMVVVLPWHDPMRVAEQTAMLDTIADGRLILGLGRGAGKVEFDGDNWFFSYRDSGKVAEIEADPTVELAYIATDRGTWVSVEGQAEVIEDDDRKRELWEDDLDDWFQGGPDDDRIVLLKVRAERIHAWAQGEELVIEPDSGIKRIES